MKAIKKPIEILAKRYTKDSDLDSLLNLLWSNKNEPVRFEESTGDLFIQKDRGEIRLTLGNWIIFEENTDRCFWFIDHEIFLETYSFLAEEGEFSRFVKKVYEIEFVDFVNLEPDSIKEVLIFIEDSGFNLDADNKQTPSTVKEQGFIIIETLEGDEKLFPGEVLIKGVRGELYPVKKENFDLLRKLAEELHGEVGASRAAVDAGFANHEEQIGQTGVTVRPKVYIACGISGAIQHVAGMKESGILISINSDPNAPINDIADYVITGSVEEVVPKMIQYYKQHSK